MNYLEQILKLLNVNVNEVFRLKGTDVLCKFSLNDLLVFDDGVWVARHEVFYAIVTGEYTIEKLPWKPTLNEEYYSIHSNLNGEILIIKGEWNYTLTDEMNYVLGNCFKTSDEARMNIRAFSTYLSTKVADTSWRYHE